MPGYLDPIVLSSLSEEVPDIPYFANEYIKN